MTRVQHLKLECRDRVKVAARPLLLSAASRLIELCIFHGLICWFPSRGRHSEKNQQLQLDDSLAQKLHPETFAVLACPCPFLASAPALAAVCSRENESHPGLGLTCLTRSGAWRCSLRGIRQWGPGEEGVSDWRTPGAEVGSGGVRTGGSSEASLQHPPSALSLSLLVASSFYSPQGTALEALRLFLGVRKGSDCRLGRSPMSHLEVR